MIFICLSLSFFHKNSPILAGVVGYEISSFITDYVGKIGFISFLIFFFLCLIVLNWNFRPENILFHINKLNKKKPVDDIPEAKIKSSNSIITNDESKISYDLEKDGVKNIVAETDLDNTRKESSIKKDKKISDNSEDFDTFVIGGEGIVQITDYQVGEEIILLDYSLQSLDDITINYDIALNQTSLSFVSGAKDYSDRVLINDS